MFRARNALAALALAAATVTSAIAASGPQLPTYNYWLWMYLNAPYKVAENDTVLYSLAKAAGGGWRSAQKFTVGSSGKIHQIDLKILLPPSYEASSTGDLVLEIYNTQNGTVFVGSPLRTATVTYASISGNYTTTWVSFKFSSSLSASAGEQLAFVLRSTKNIDDKGVYRMAANSGQYSGGNGYVHRSGWYHWYAAGSQYPELDDPNAKEDWLFRVWSHGANPLYYPGVVSSTTLAVR